MTVNVVHVEAYEALDGEVYLSWSEANQASKRWQEQYGITETRIVSEINSLSTNSNIALPTKFPVVILDYTPIDSPAVYLASDYASLYTLLIGLVKKYVNASNDSLTKAVGQRIVEEQRYGAALGFIDKFVGYIVQPFTKVG